VALQVLEPPYVQPVPLCHPRPPVGAILIADLGDGIPALSRAVLHSRDAPWCPLVSLLGDRTVPASSLATFEPVPGTWASLYSSDFAHLPLGARAVAAVRRRPVPQATTIAQWVEARLRRTGSASVLAACCGEGGDALRPPRTLTRRVQALGPLEVRDWRGLARLAQLLAARPPRFPAALETTAFEAEVDPRTLRRWLRLATDRSWAEAGELIGWEWVVESALRRYGYLEFGELRRVSGTWGKLRTGDRRTV
jgi:hypothetical protein